MFAPSVSLADLCARLSRLVESVRSNFAAWRHGLQARVQSLGERVTNSIATACRTAVSTTRGASAVLAVALPLLTARVRLQPAPQAALPAAARAYVGLASLGLLAAGLGLPPVLVGLLGLATGLAKLALIALVLAPLIWRFAEPGRLTDLGHGLRTVAAGGLLALSGLGILAGQALAPRPAAAFTVPAPGDVATTQIWRTAPRMAPPISEALDPESILAAGGRRNGQA